MFKIPYCVSNFNRIRSNDFLYVDKTHFIEKLEAIDYVLHLRPRRFGKSLFLSMLDSYYDVASADKFDELFSGLYIHENPTKDRNNYYVLRFDFSGIQNTKASSLEDGFVGKVESGAKNFISRYDLGIKLPELNSAADILRVLLTEFFALKLAHKIYILIDEYDHFTNAVLAGDGDDFLELLRRGGFVRAFYEIIKENVGSGLIERFFITGVMPVTLDSMTSGFNIATNITTNENFADLMGFNGDEVREILNLTYAKPGQNSKEKITVQLTTAEQAETFKTFEANYNGYLFAEESETKVFNSNLIMYYLQNYLPSKRPPKSLIDENLNQRTTTIESIASLKNREQNYQVIEEVITTGQTAGTLQPAINIDKKFDKNDFITMLFNIGLLTIKEAGFTLKFEIPNKIIENIYLQYLGDLLQRRHSYKIDLNEQEKALAQFGEAGKLVDLTVLVSKFLQHTSGRNAINFDEKYVKLIYKILLSSTAQFIVYDEFPTLQGFADLVVFKAENSYAKYEALIEIKYLKKGETTEAKVEKALADGIAQITRYLQDERLASRENLKKFVVVFAGFEVACLQEIGEKA